MPRKRASKAPENREMTASQPGRAMAGKRQRAVSGSGAAGSGSEENQVRKNGGWREIEARRERAALKASLADVWDEDFDLDDEILAELDHTAEYFTQQEEELDEDFDEDEELDDFFEDDEDV